MITASSLRKMADILERHPRLQEHSVGVDWYGLSIYVYPSYQDEKPVEGSAAKKVAEIVRYLRHDPACSDPVVKKEATDYTFTMTIIFGDLQVRVHSGRNSVCRKVETGEVTYVEQTDPKAPKIKVAVPVIKWECDPILSDASQ